jgi:hypothetical protein
MKNMLIASLVLGATIAGLILLAKNRNSTTIGGNSGNGLSLGDGLGMGERIPASTMG